jgi:methionyl-tRNA formyltransferase
MKLFTIGYADNTMTHYILDYFLSHGVMVDGAIFIKSPLKKGWKRLLKKVKGRGVIPAIRRVAENLLVRKIKIAQISHSRLDKVYFVDKVNSEEVRDILTVNKVTLLVLTSTPIIKPIILDIEVLTILNAHTGWLPTYRGLDANIKAMRDGHHLGVSVHKVTRKIDGGEIYLRQKFHIDFHGDILGQMDQKELELSGKLLVEAIELKKKDNLKAIALSEALGKYERRLTKKETDEIIRCVKRGAFASLEKDIT